MTYPFPTPSPRSRAKHPEHYLVDPDTGCWVWQRGTMRGGYGVIPIKGVLHRAHRYAYEQIVGPVPPGLDLDHFVCQRPACVNPAHLEPVTRAENAHRGRKSKITMDQARQIRAQVASGRPRREVAAEFGLAVGSIGNITSGRQWREDAVA